MIVILILLLVVIAYAGYIYLRERPPADPIKPTVPADKVAGDEPDKAG